jgi:hypothetical protein
MQTNNQTWMQAQVLNPKEKGNKEWMKGWAPSGATLQDLRKSAADFANYVGGNIGNTAGEIGQAAGRGLKAVGGAAMKIGQAESNLTQPVREAALEAAWRSLQQFNYFFGMPYSTGSYKDEIETYRKNHNGAVPPGPHSQYVTPSQPYGPNPTPAGPPVPAAPASPATPSQAALNQQWMQFWNNQGPRPAAGTVYKP